MSGILSSTPTALWVDDVTPKEHTYEQTRRSHRAGADVQLK